MNKGFTNTFAEVSSELVTRFTKSEYYNIFTNDKGGVKKIIVTKDDRIYTLTLNSIGEWIYGCLRRRLDSNKNVADTFTELLHSNTDYTTIADMQEYHNTLRSMKFKQGVKK